MAEKNKGILEMLNRGILSAASYPYNFASDFTNAIPFVNTPYIDADADGFMQGGFVDKKDFDAVEGFGVEKLNKRIADKKAKDSGIAALTDEKFYEDKILRDLKRKKEKENNSKKTTEKTDNKKETTAEKEKDDRGMLQKFFEKYDLVSLGNAIGRGDGLLNEIERQDKEITALSTAAEEKQYQRGREGLADALSISKAEVDKLYKEGMINTTLTSRAFLFASTLAEPGTPEYSAAVRKYLEDNTSSAAGKALGLSTPQDVTQQALIQLMQKNPNFADILKSLQDENYSTTLGNSAASTDIDATAGIK